MDSSTEIQTNERLHQLFHCRKDWSQHSRKSKDWNSGQTYGSNQITKSISMNLLSQKCDEEIAMNDRAKNKKQLQDSFQISSGLHMKTKELKLTWPYGAHKPFARWSERHSMALSSLHWLVDSSSIERNKGNKCNSRDAPTMCVTFPSINVGLPMHEIHKLPVATLVGQQRKRNHKWHHLCCKHTPLITPWSKICVDIATAA